MHKIIFNKDKNQFDLYTKEDATDQINDGYFIMSDSLEAILEYKILELISGLTWENCSKNPCKKIVEKLIYVSSVVKSKSKKSVYQYKDFSEHYNLPESLREQKFNSIIGRMAGPFYKKKVGSQLIDTSEWYKYDIIFTGSAYQCIIKLAFIIMHDFILNEVCNCLLSTVDNLDGAKKVTTEIETLTKEDLLEARIKKVYFEIKKDYQDEVENHIEEEHDLQDLLDMAEEEERWMDEETDGFWRWNID